MIVTFHCCRFVGYGQGMPCPRRRMEGASKFRKPLRGRVGFCRGGSGAARNQGASRSAPTNRSLPLTVLRRPPCLALGDACVAPTVTVLHSNDTVVLRHTASGFRRKGLSGGPAPFTTCKENRQRKVLIFVGKAVFHGSISMVSGVSEPLRNDSFLGTPVATPRPASPQES